MLLSLTFFQFGESFRSLIPPKHYSIIQYGLHHRHSNEKRDKYFYERKETSGSRAEEREKQIPSKNENLRNKEHSAVYVFAMIQCKGHASV